MLKTSRAVTFIIKHKKATGLIILLTDGLANRGIGQEQGLIDAAKRIQKDGITILVVAIGQFSRHQLKNMVPKENIYQTKGIASTCFGFLRDFLRSV